MHALSEFVSFFGNYYVGVPVSIILGLIFGSFATMASYRIPLGEDLVVKPSHCPECNHRLSIKDLFPLFSWIINRGKCRYCHTKISERYPLIEIMMAIIFAAIYLKFGFSFISLCVTMLAVCLVILSTIELEQRTVPHILLIAILVLGILYRYLLNTEINIYFFSALTGFSFALLVQNLMKKWKKIILLGKEDFYFLTICGMWLSINLFAGFVIFALIIGGIFFFIFKDKFEEEGMPLITPASIALIISLLIA